MLNNDQFYWVPREDFNPVSLSWGTAKSFDALKEHTKLRWDILKKRLLDANLGVPSGEVLEFGPGLGLMDGLFGDEVKRLIFLDHTDKYLDANPEERSDRCEFATWSASNLLELQSRLFKQLDWVYTIATFYHIDTASAVAMILELGKLLKPGGLFMIYGWSDSRTLRDGPLCRLFGIYPHYVINMEDVVEAVKPELERVLYFPDAWPMVVFRSAVSG